MRAVCREMEGEMKGEGWSLHDVVRAVSGERGGRMDGEGWRVCDVGCVQGEG